jgi:hypothetical protein
MGEADKKIRMPPVYRKNSIISSAICHKNNKKEFDNTGDGPLQPRPRVQAGLEQYRVRQEQRLNWRLT